MGFCARLSCGCLPLETHQGPKGCSPTLVRKDFLDNVSGPLRKHTGHRPAEMLLRDRNHTHSADLLGLYGLLFSIAVPRALEDQALSFYCHVHKDDMVYPVDFLSVVF